MDSLAPKTSGIYAITNITNGKCYIGSSIDIPDRWRGHICDLERVEHHSRYLQRAWRLYGSESFQFSLLELVEDVTQLIKREQFHMDVRFHAKGTIEYNMSPTAGSCLGVRRSMSTRHKYSLAHLGLAWSEARREAHLIRKMIGPSEGQQEYWKRKRGQSWTEAQRLAQEAVRKPPTSEQLAALAYGRSIMPLVCKGRPRTEKQLAADKAHRGRMTEAQWEVVRRRQAQGLTEREKEARIRLRGGTWTPEQRARLMEYVIHPSPAQLAYYERRRTEAPTEARLAYWESMRGQVRGPHSADTKAKIGTANSIANKGKPWSPARRAAEEARRASIYELPVQLPLFE